VPAMTTKVGRRFIAMIAISIVGLGGAAVGIALVAGVPVARSAFPGVNGNIAFERYHSGNDVYLIRPDGTHERRITSTASAEFPAFSADGRRIAFTGRPGLGDEDVYVMHADGTHRRRLTHSPAGEGLPAFAPSGREIVFRKAFRNGDADIYAISNAGTHQRRLTEDGYNTTPTVSPSGDKIAFTSYRDGNYEIYVMNADGTHERNLTHSPGSDGTPDFSPSGNRIAFWSDRDGDQEVYVMRADGTRVRNVTRNAADDYTPAFSPNGERIVFVSERDNPNGDLYLMSADGSHQSRLTDRPAGAQAPDWGVQP
jgi:Tol biopolymer transport system component